MARMTGWVRYLFPLLLLAASLSSAQDLSPKQSDAVIKLSTDLVVVDAQVLSKKTGHLVVGLQPDDFLLYEDGVKQEITHFSQDEAPLSIILMLDVSSSVQGVIDQIQAGAGQAMQQLKSEDEVALMIFSGRAKLVQDFTKDRQLIETGIANIKDNPLSFWARSGTFINEAVYQAATHMRRATNPLSRRVIIGMTDDESNQLPFLGHSRGQALEKLHESGSVVCGLFVRDYFLASLNEVTSKILYRKSLSGSVSVYANKTGGEIMNARREEIENKLVELIDHLRARYTLAYTPANSQPDGKFRKIKLKVSPEVEKREGMLTIRTRQGYYARGRDNSQAR